MKIELSKEQIDMLLNALYVASCQMDKDEEAREMNSLANYIFNQHENKEN